VSAEIKHPVEDPIFREVVLPIVAVERDTSWHAIGTGAIVAADEFQAVLLTAAHTLQHVVHIDRPRPRSHPTTPPEFRPPDARTINLVSTNIYALYDRDGECRVCPITKSWYLSGLDVAFSVVNLDHRDGLTFRHRIAVDFAEPKMGESVSAIAYTGLQATADGTLEQPSATVRLQPTWRQGQIVNVCPQGSGLCRWPCFETNIPFDSGMSGGPMVQVVGHEVVVRGIVDADLSLGEDASKGTGLHSIAATLWPSLGTEIAVHDGEGLKRIQLIDLIRHGKIDDRSNSTAHFSSVTDDEGQHLYWK
jgi:hypothetical protein